MPLRFLSVLQQGEAADFQRKKGLLKKMDWKFMKGAFLLFQFFESCEDFHQFVFRISLLGNE